MFAGFLPVERRELFDLPVGHAGQPFQHVFEILLGIDAVHPAVLYQGEDHRVARAGFFRAEEQPSLFSHCGRPDRVLVSGHTKPATKGRMETN